MSASTLYLCAEHGAGHDNCCKEAEDMGFIEFPDED